MNLYGIDIKTKQGPNVYKKHLAVKAISWTDAFQQVKTALRQEVEKLDESSIFTIMSIKIIRYGGIK